MLTLVLDDAAFTAASRTNALCLHHTEDALRGVGDDARAVTCRTLLRHAAGLGACTVTMRAGNILAHLELLGDAVCYLLQRQAHLQTQVRTAMLLASALGTTAKPAKSSMSAKDVAEHREDVVHIHRGATKRVEATASTRSVKSECVVLLTFLRVVQHVISLGSLLELFLSFLVAGVTVRVVFDGDGAVRLLDLVFCGVLVYAKHLIIVSFLCHFSYFLHLTSDILLSYGHFGVANYFVV